MNKDIRKGLSLNKIDYYETHLSLINCLIPIKMTPMQIKVIAVFMSLEGEIAKYRFGPTAKKIVKTTLGLSPAGLSNYIGDLLKAGFLIQNIDIIEIHPKLEINPDSQMYYFKLVNKDSNATVNTQGNHKAVLGREQI